MTALTATVDLPGKGGDISEQKLASGYYDLLGALVNGDTITFPNILPYGGAKVVNVKAVSPELDSNATPTATATIGNSDDPDGYVKTRGLAVTLSNSLATDLVLESSDGALINTAVTNRDIVLTVTAAVATGATSGRIRLSALLQALPA